MVTSRSSGSLLRRPEVVVRDVCGDLPPNLGAVSDGMPPVEAAPYPGVSNLAHHRVQLLVPAGRLHELGDGGLRSDNRPKASPAAEPWRTWGGPRGNFTSAATGLAAAWPAGGPPRVWKRTLGDGYSGISAEYGVLYTAYRRGSNDVVIAIDEGPGKTLWETAYAAPFSNAGGGGIAPGPYAMPQVIGDRIVMASGTGVLLSLDKRTGKIVWQHDLYREFGGTRLGFGYSCHPLPYKTR
jgi:hypothetical protein